MKTTEEYIDKLNSLITVLSEQENLIRNVSRDKDFHQYSNTLSELRIGIRKNAIINLYTSWESYVKKVFFETIFYHQDVLNNVNLFKKIVEKVTKKNYLSNSFYDLTNSKMYLSKDVIAPSNNMTMDIFLSIISEFDFSKEDFYKHVELGIRDSEYPKIVSFEDIKELCPQLEIDKENTLDIPKNTSEILKFYFEQVYMLVKFRNRLAHLDEVTNIWSIEEIQAVSKIIKSLMLTIDEYLISQVLKKYHESSKSSVSFIKVNVTSVYPRLQVLEIDPESSQRGKKIKNLHFIAKDRKKKIYRNIKIGQLKNEKRNRCQNIPALGKCSIGIESIELWNLKESKEEIYIYEQLEKKTPLVLNIEVTDFD
ncbi:HEPN domain-containing protein [Enterococcus casseliflavus]|uniref:HEPN domain-containing protein n=1 Tax=Enterococcus casseliflavus TaxID=37734 RepID=UPI003EE28F03